MSDWTHVAGVVVLDTFNFESIFSEDLPKKEEVIEAFKKHIGPLSPFGAYNRESTLPSTALASVIITERVLYKIFQKPLNSSEKPQKMICLQLNTP